MNQAQSTGEPLGGSSRDGERGSRSQRRTANSSGFLVDSFLPRSSKSFRTSGHHSRRSETDRRGNPGKFEAETTPKKRSRFRWSRQRGSTKESEASQDAIDDTEVLSSPNSSRNTTIPESHGDRAAHHTGSRAESSNDPAALGLDQDSLQIINLALNLSESRRKGNIGYQASNQVSRGSWAPSGVSRASAAGSIPSHSSYPGISATQSLEDGRERFANLPISMVTNDVLNSLPKSATSEPTPQGFSEGTLARAANARRYFELRHEYLRLLPYLPPLKPHSRHYTTGSQDYHQPHRAYNPLQVIRNRKVRFRERCPIDSEAEGWNDVEKVHSWVKSIEAAYNRKARNSLECLKLPPFKGRNPDGPLGRDVDGVDPSPTSPSSSLRRISRTGSIKSRRPRSDWLIYPDELLADAAWVEDAQNKSKITDKDGNILYPNPTSFVVIDVHQEEIQERSSLNTGRPPSHASHSDARQSLSLDPKELGRGRQSYRFRTPRRSSSVSEEDTGTKRRKFKIRSRSSSSSSANERPYRGSLFSNVKSPRRSVSPLRRKRMIYDEKRGSVSSVPSADDRYDPLSLMRMGGHWTNTGMDIGYFPSIASNLSPPSSRSSSPAKRGLTQGGGSRRAHSRSSRHRKDPDDNSSVEFEATRKDSLSFTNGDTQVDDEPQPLPKASTYHAESRHAESRRMNLHERKDSVPHESKLRGIFKGPGKIAGKVGNEVSKMGDFILKKDSGGHSRQSSLAISDDSESEDEETKSEKLAIPKALLRRLPTFSDDLGRSTPRNSDKSLTKTQTQTPPTIVELRQQRDEIEFVGRHGQLLDLQGDTGNLFAHHNSKPPGHTVKRGPRNLQFGPEIHTVRNEIGKGRIKDDLVPFSIARPRITGLAKAQPTPTKSSHSVRPALSSQSRSWSISDRSVSVSIESGVPGKQEIQRTKALLLSSGIKAREIARRAEEVRRPPPEFLQRSFGPDSAIPSVPRLYEHEVSSQRLLKRIEASHKSFESSMERVPKAAFLPLKSKLSTLEDLIDKSLNTRVRVAAEEAENLSMQLNTTSTLAVKQLSDTLDHGLRKRHRRLRWLRRTGFVMLEWALIGLLWWVWLIVVVFKLLRKLFRGLVSGVRWILWL
ncbi:hypothetical protein BDW66DRAFT_127041 [Aspergillus desertorum]